MAITFHGDGATYVVAQTRRAFRRALHIFIVVLILDVPLMGFLLANPPAPGTTGPKVGLLLVSAAIGVVFILWMLAPFSAETRAVFDRARGLVTVTGRRFPRRTWSLERPLSDLSELVLTAIRLPHGGRAYRLYAVFGDGARALLCAPARMSLATLRTEAGALRSFVWPERTG